MTAYDLTTAIAKNFLWLVLLGWSTFRFFRYSPTKNPRPDSCPWKNYKSWRELEAAAIQCAVAGTVLSILFTLFIVPRSLNDVFNLGAIRAIFWVVGLLAILAIQSAAQTKGKKMGIL